jgi:aryl-alcohol dehydrogenase-like predicted oxidoreductase
VPTAQRSACCRHRLAHDAHAGSHEGASDESIAEPFGALAELQQEGLIRHLGLSGVSDAQLTEA